MGSAGDDLLGVYIATLLYGELCGWPICIIKGYVGDVDGAVGIDSINGGTRGWGRRGEGFLGGRVSDGGGVDGEDGFDAGRTRWDGVFRKGVAIGQLVKIEIRGG